MRRRLGLALGGVAVVLAGSLGVLDLLGGPIDLAGVRDSRISTVSVDDNVEAELGFVSMDPDASVDEVAAALAELDRRTAAGEVDEWTLFLGDGVFGRSYPEDPTTFSVEGRTGAVGDPHDRATVLLAAARSPAVGAVVGALGTSSTRVALRASADPEGAGEDVARLLDAAAADEVLRGAVDSVSAPASVSSPSTVVRPGSEGVTPGLAADYRRLARAADAPSGRLGVVGLGLEVGDTAGGTLYSVDLADADGDGVPPVDLTIGEYRDELDPLLRSLASFVARAPAGTRLEVTQPTSARPLVSIRNDRAPRPRNRPPYEWSTRTYGFLREAR